jgi:hypothetical protein
MPRGLAAGATTGVAFVRTVAGEGNSLASVIISEEAEWNGTQQLGTWEQQDRKVE